MRYIKKLKSWNENVVQSLAVTQLQMMLINIEPILKIQDVLTD